jgi:hypothetical protein
MDESTFLAILTAHTKADLMVYLKSKDFKVRQYASDKLKRISDKNYKPIFSLEDIDNLEEEEIAI